MRKPLLFLFMLANALFALEQFNISIGQPANITPDEDDYPNFEPGMLFLRNHTLYVPDRGTPAIFEYSEEGNFSKLASTLPLPVAIYIDEDGRMYVADGSDGIVRRSPSKVIFDYAMPSGITMDNGTFYITESDEDRLLSVSSDGLIFHYLGGPGTLTGEFSEPKDIEAHDHVLYVADSGNGRVQALTTGLEHVRTYGAGMGDVFLKDPSGVFVDDDYVYVADEIGNKVVIYTKDAYPVFVYEIETPRDIVVDGSTIYISQGYRLNIFKGRVSLPDPAGYADYVFSSLSPAFSEYSENSEVASALGMAYNSTLVSQWKSAALALELRNYGESFYKSMGLKNVNISSLNSSLESSLKSAITARVQNSTAKDEILSLLSRGDVPAAYQKLIGSPQVPANTTNASGQNTTALLNTSLLESRLADAKALMASYNLSVSGVEGIEAQIALARTNSSAYSSAELMLDALDQQIGLLTYKIENAKGRIDSLESEIAREQLFADYSKAQELLQNASALLCSNPEEAARLADQGLAELQKARDSAAGAIYLLGAAAFVFMCIVVLFLIFRDRIIPPHGKEYRFKKGE